MTSSSSWKLDQAACEVADERGQEVARLHGFVAPPVDPFVVVEAERALIQAAGDDFGDAFDGRLSYVGQRFLLCYNTKYDRWPHRGSHHPKVRFTVAHELGHFYLDEHRRALVLRGATHGSFTEFATSKLVERQADCFAAGMLMPRYLVGRRINIEPEPNLALIYECAALFDVSLTSMMVRWTQLSDFPCATLCVSDGKIAWGFVSRAFRSGGFWRARRGAAVQSHDACRFVAEEADASRYGEEEGSGLAPAWLEGSDHSIAVKEFYARIPSARAIMVFLTADEDDLPQLPDDE